ncbi:MAG: hypothetical protein C5B51_13920 [Terriglobia bacterium]|nr:MAG: hypothetical protein C5B51_13920 [Terriglobia bacterium]
MKKWSFLLIVFSIKAVPAQSGQPAAAAITPIVLPRQLSLPQAEEMLLQRNLAVVAGRQQLEVSQALRLIAGYKPNPVLQIGAEQFPIYSPVAGSYPRFFSTNSDTGAEPTYTIQFNKVFERGGKREFREAQAEAQVDAARAQILDAFRTQLLQLRQAFVAAMLARENLKLAQSIDQQYQQTEDLTVLRVNAGDQAGMELFRVKAGRLPYKQAIIDAQTSYQQALQDMANLLNASVDAGSGVRGASNITSAAAQTTPPALTPAVEVVGTFAERTLGHTVDELRSMALARRPDVQAAQNNLRAAESGLRLAQAQRARDVSLGVEYQRVGNDSAVGVVAQVPLFLYNNQKAAIAQASAQQRLLEAQLRQVETQALTDVEKAYQAFTAAQTTTALYSTENLIQVAKLRDAIEYSYRRGEASLFELLDAQRTASQAAVAYNQARANYQLALWQMEAALGGPLE